MFVLIVLTTLLTSGLCTDPVQWMSASDFTTNGIRNEPRIVNGLDAADGELPYVAKLSNDGAVPCAASIISETWAVTEAACCQRNPASNSTLYYGSANLDGNGVSGKIKQNVIHPNYTGSYYDCICLVELSKPIKFNKNVQPISLPTQNAEAGTLVDVSGWGFLHPVQDEEYPNTLQRIRKSIVQQKEICDEYGPDRRDTQMCLFPADNAEICNGDMAAPVASLRTEGETTTLYGFVNAYRAYCNNRGLPTYFISLVKYVDWINKVTGAV